MQHNIARHNTCFYMQPFIAYMFARVTIGTLSKRHNQTAIHFINEYKLQNRNRSINPPKHHVS